MINSDPDKMLKRHQQLNHSERMAVVSHVQRESGDWILNTLMVDGCDVPFKYKRKQRYKNLQGQRVNLTYYASTELVAGLEMEVMKVTRVKRS